VAKTNRRPSDKLERKQRLAQRPVRQEDEFNDQDWLRALDESDEEVADEITSPITNAAY
jgi:hypothetical protein